MDLWLCGATRAHRERTRLLVGVSEAGHLGALRLALVPAIVTILFTDLFDSLSTFIGVASASGLVDRDGKPINLRRGLIVDSFATFGAGLVGTSPGTAYVESIAGIRMGARTGRASVVTALCFLPCSVRRTAGLQPFRATPPPPCSCSLASRCSRP